MQINDNNNKFIQKALFECKPAFQSTELQYES